MRYQLGVEDMEADHWIAWVLGLPGCYSSAPSQEAAIAQAPASIAAYDAWLAHHARRFAPSSGRFDVQVVEVFRSFVSEGDYVVNAFFEDDRRPLGHADVEEALWLLDCTRSDLLGVVEPLSPEQLSQAVGGGKQESIGQILDHVAWAEWWYFDRLGLAFERAEMPPDPLEKIAKSRAQTRAQLPRLIGDDQIVDRRGERWSARKVLRRTLWHERDHTQQIATSRKR